MAKGSFRRSNSRVKDLIVKFEDDAGKRQEGIKNCDISIMNHSNKGWKLIRLSNQFKFHTNLINSKCWRSISFGPNPLSPDSDLSTAIEVTKCVGDDVVGRIAGKRLSNCKRCWLFMTF